MRVIIAGSRTITGETARHLVWNAINNSGWAGSITEVIHGNARGVDAAAGEVAEPHWPVKVFPADWARHGKAAGAIRNREMAEYADALIAIWDGKSRGTENMIDEARRCGLPIHIERPKAKESP